jgi:hypothetical protein
MSGFLTDADRADMLASLSESWTQTAAISRNDGADNWATIASGVPCRAVASRVPQEVTIAGELRAVVPWLINLPDGTDVGAADRVTIAGRTFEVIASVDPLDQALIRQVQAVEVG